VVKACLHLFPKQDTLYTETRYFVAVSGDFIIRNGKFYPETGDFVARNGNFVSGNRISLLCIQTQATVLPFLATKSPVSGYKVSCFGNQCGQAFRVWDL